MEKYTKIRVLGKGSFGSAILIKRRSDNALFVIKEVFLGRLKEKERMDARQECRMLQKLDHPNIVRYVEHFENRNNLYIVMEYCDGGDLHGKLKYGPMKESTILSYYSQVCLAMEYLHSRHILHRDIKTMNVFLMKNGSVKLGDFGIATVLRNTMGMANTVCGTPYYFSPEICRNKPYNNKSDVWALGVLLYEMATGRHPFDGNNMQQLMQRIVRGNYNPLPSHFSREFRKMVDWCLQKDPAMRPSIKQTLSLPIVRRSLERLEEDLMLATQCKIRLKDIIAYDVAADSSSRIEVPSPKREDRPLLHPQGMSPGKMAAIALAKQQQQQQQARAAENCPRGQQISPRHAPPGGPSRGDPSGQRFREYMVQVSPKPCAATPVVDRGRLEVYRRDVQQLCKRPLGDLKQAVQLHPHQRLHNPYQPQQQQQPGAPYRQPAQQPKPAPVEVHRPAPRVTKAKQAINGSPEGFQERIERINAIVERYAKDVDPSAVNTIHAYMKRKQEEYLQRQKARNQRSRLRKELKRQELLKVIEQQKKIARADKIRKYIGEQNQTPRKCRPEGEAPVQCPQPPPPDVNAAPSSLRRQHSPPHNVPRVSQQILQVCEARCGRAVPRVTPLPSKHNGNLGNPSHCLNNVHLLNEGVKEGVSRVGYSGAMEGQQQQQQLPGSPSKSNGCVAAERCDFAFPRPVVYKDVGNLNSSPRFVPNSQPVAAPLDLRLKKHTDAVDSQVARQVPAETKGPFYLVVPTGDEVLHKPHSLQQQIGHRRVLSSVPGPLPPTYTTESPREASEDGGCFAKKRHSTEEVSKPVACAPAVGRRNSAPLVSPTEKSKSSRESPSKHRNVDDGVCLFRPTRAALGDPDSAPQQQEQRPPSLRNSSLTKDLPALRVSSPVAPIRLEDLPAAVDKRRKLEQYMRRQEQVLGVGLSCDEHSSKGGVGICRRSRSCLPDYFAHKKNVASSEPNLKDGEACPSTSQIIFSKPSDCKPNGEKSKMEADPPSTLAPLQHRAGAGRAPRHHVSSPIAFSTPVSPSGLQRAGAGQGKVCQVLQRGGVCRNDRAPPVPPPVPQFAIAAEKIVPKPCHPAPTRGKKSEEDIDLKRTKSVNTPILIDICYDVVPSVSDDASKKISGEMFNSPTLPSLTDVVVDPPDVAQQWRNFSENNANGKAPHRVLHSNAAGPGIHRNAKFTRSTDDMAVFHRVDGARLGTPCTLEVLGDSSTCSTVSTQNSPTRSGPCSLLGNFSVSNACRRDHQEELPSITSASHVFSPRSERGCVSASLSCTSVYQMREELERGETVAFNGLEEQPCDAPADGSTDVEGSGANPTEVATDASLGGYLLMLDHLRNLLYRHTPSSLAESPRTSLEINQVDGKVKVRDTAEALHRVPDNDGKETDVDESGSDELALGEDYSSELCVGDGSDDFGDAEEPTPAQRAEIEDTYRRFLANAEFLPHVDGFGCDHAGDAANADRSEVQLGGRGAEVSEQNGEGLG